ncbi:FAD-binding protein [Ketobacter sp.]|uniref:FAD-binding protein n=1 Tax=Ketobacter sp. TaxID=2083498 RepID=UPI000F1E744E|nr:FAD-binding protein [Ketobacter sp.]RLT98714.1 MAG: FAD-binding protein [Ketobacter sp.]
MTINLPTHWDLEADLVAVGSGGAGLTSAITAVDHGISALVLESSDQVGGVTAYSMGEVWIPGNHLAPGAGIEDSIEKGYRYVKNLSMGYGEPLAILNQSVHGPIALKYFEDTIGLKMSVIRDLPDYYYPYSEDGLPEGRYLEAVPFPASALGEWQSKTRVSPHVPYSLTHEDIFRGGGMANMAGWDYEVMAKRLTHDERTTGPGLAAYFVKGALDLEIPIHTGVHAEELISDGERIIGVRATRDGKTIHVRAHRGVVLAVSSYERNASYAKTLGHQLEVQSMVMPTVDGAHLRLAGQVGGRIARVPDVTLLGFHVPGEEQENGLPLWRGALPFLGLPHTIVVNKAGKRFANEGFYRSIYYATDVIDGNTQTHANFPCWAVFDRQAREKYPFGSLMPMQEMPEALGTSADTLAELAQKIGVDQAALEATVARFNGFCATGVDEDFQRGTHPWGALMCGDQTRKPNGNLGPLEKGPYYAVRLHRLAGGGIASTGIMADQHCRVMGWNDKPVEGLYVAGNSQARLDNGAFMQSGITNARGLTHGYLAGRHAAGKPSDELDKALRQFEL